MVLADFIFLVLCIVGVLVLATQRTFLWVWAFFFGSLGILWHVTAGTTAHSIIATIFFVLMVGSLLFSFIPIRQRLFSAPIFRRARRYKAHISSLEKQALAAGSTGFEIGFFEGKPRWDELRSYEIKPLTPNEQKFLEGPIKKFCELTHDWKIRQSRVIPDSLWEYAKQEGFSGLRVRKEWGGKQYSFQAQSIMLSKVATRAVDSAIFIELPTSLYPDEIINEYGTDEQKKYYLPRLAKGEEVVSFAVTGAQGSDVGGMTDEGVVTYGEHEGQQTLGVRINCNKRYITFAPKASLFVLAFSLKDPEGHLGLGSEPGITLALIPATHEGINAEKRHFPMGLAFPHGSIEATDMFIPLAWIIGERRGVGLGWKMIMQCLFMGRALALPSISVGSIKLALLTTSAYARVRRQFGLSIDTYEGIKESLAELVELTYVSEAARSLTAALVDSGLRPLAVSSLMKYRITENARSAINHALDVHAGKGACDGPANYLLSAYNAVPIGVTVEGANIVSRSVITFAQGVLQSHPFVRPALESCESKNYKQDLDDFDSAISGHIQLLQANAARSFLHAISGGVFASCPRDVPKDIRNWYRALSRYTSSFAYLSDVTVITMGHELKKKQKLGGRLADVLAELYILSAVLKQYEEDGFPAEDYPIIEQSLTNGLYRIEKNLLAVIRNFPQRLLRPLLFSIVFPVGAWRQPAKDALTTTVADSVSEATPTRARLTRHVFISDSSNDSVRQLENAFVAANHAASVYKKIRAATRAGLLKKDHTQLQVAESKGIITSEEAHLLQEAEKTAKVAIAVDTFEQDVYRPA